MISIHALLAESDNSAYGALDGASISIHALLAESDGLNYFYIIKITISIHALLAESDLRVLDGSKSSIISIHALLAESDGCQRPCEHPTKDFYPRSPCGERLSTLTIGFSGRVFLSTLSLRRATCTLRQLQSALCYFYPRSPCGERPLRVMRRPYAKMHFYPRSPCGERPRIACEANKAGKISIHALLAESDVMYTLKVADLMLFLSTLSLRRATRSWTNWPTKHRLFLSTLSLRRATWDRNDFDKS